MMMTAQALMVLASIAMWFSTISERPMSHKGSNEMYMSGICTCSYLEKGVGMASALPMK